MLLHGVASTSNEAIPQLCELADFAGRIPLLTAILFGRIEVALLLLKYSNKLLLSRDSCGSSPLHAAAAMGMVGVVSAVLAACPPQDLDSLLNCVSCPLPSVRETPQHVKNVPWLHQWKQKQRQSPGNTSAFPRWGMHTSSHAGTENHTLLECSALHLAIRSGHFQIVQLLVDARADPMLRDQSQITPTVEEISKDKKSASSITSPSGRSPLEIAASLGQVDTMQLLLSRGATLTGTCEHDIRAGRLMLLQACFDLNTHVAKLLLQSNVDVNKPMYARWTGLPFNPARQWTPLYLAFGFQNKSSFANSTTGDSRTQFAGVCVLVLCSSNLCVFKCLIVYM